MLAPGCVSDGGLTQIGATPHCAGTPRFNPRFNRDNSKEAANEKADAEFYDLVRDVALSPVCDTGERPLFSPRTPVPVLGGARISPRPLGHAVNGETRRAN